MEDGKGAGDGNGGWSRSQGRWEMEEGSHGRWKSWKMGKGLGTANTKVWPCGTKVRGRFGQKQVQVATLMMSYNTACASA